MCVYVYMYVYGVTEGQAVDILARFLPRSGESRLDVGRSFDDSVLSGPAIVESVETMLECLFVSRLLLRWSRWCRLPVCLLLCCG
jgi:hypothetical protein